jgi:hypothetical protein
MEHSIVDEFPRTINATQRISSNHPTAWNHPFGILPTGWNGIHVVAKSDEQAPALFGI